MDQAAKLAALDHPRPSPPWRGEPQLGGWYTEEEIEAAVAAIRSSMDWTGEGFGFIVKEITDFEAAFAKYIGAQHAVSLCTASVGLDLSMRALDLEPGDEVIAPAMNFRAAHHAIIGAGGTLVLCEVEPDGLCADPADVERRITPRTRAICVTHMNGLAAPIDDYVALGERHPHPVHGPLPVIADAARAVGVGYKGGKAGGDASWCTVYSFHTMKLMTTLGEGGMVTTNDPELAARLRANRQWGEATEYWGSSFKLTKVQAAVGLVQLRRLDEMNGLRIRRALERTAMLEDVPELTLPRRTADREHTYYLYTVLVPEDWAGEKRDRIRAVMLEYGVGTEVANPPTYETSPHIRRHTQGQRLPATELLARRIICLPLHPLMTEADNAYVAAVAQEAVERVRAEG